jgi:hypothetical protein
VLFERLLLSCLLLVRELRRIAAGRLLGANTELQERRADGLDLLLHRRPDVERRHDRAETPRGRDRLEAGDTGAEHEDARRRDRPRRGHQEGKQLRHAVGADQRSLVARDGRLGGQRIHRLRARDARDRLHRERDHAVPLEPLNAFPIGQRLEEADQDDA